MRFRQALAMGGLLSVCVLGSGCAAPAESPADDASQQAVVAATAVKEITCTALNAVLVEYGLVEGLRLDPHGHLEMTEAFEAKDNEKALRSFLKSQKNASKLGTIIEKQFPNVKFVIFDPARPITPEQYKVIAKEADVVRNAIVKLSPEAFAKAFPEAIKPTATISMKALALLEGANAAAARVTTAFLGAAGRRLGLSLSAAELATAAGQLFSKANIVATVGMVVYEATSFTVKKTGLDAYIVDALLGDGAEPPATWQSISNDEYAVARDKWRGLMQWSKDATGQAYPWQGRATSIARSYFKIKHIENANRPAQNETQSLETFVGFLSDPALNDPKDPAPMALAGAKLMAQLSVERGVDWSEAACDAFERESATP